MIKIAVCDDNIQFARILIDKIRVLCAQMIPERIKCEIITEFTSAKSVIEYLKKSTIDLLFLDIAMPVRSGFDLAKELIQISPDTVIVFVSSHSSWVFKSFDYSPLAYLRKNRMDEELPAILSRAIDACIYSKDTLDFSTIEGNVTIKIKDIIYIESQKNYFIISCKNNAYKCRGTITNVEQYVKDYDFVRIHAAYLVNLDNVLRYSNDNTIRMNNGAVLPVSQRRSAEFKNAYLKYSRRG